eukprot:TRINITY_DN8610_c0_g4_i5.p1 TRINITY_DN8610_c0_g4~~TRINITY_DN8610_c0_g4_i5.p1  ORF type:complete len:578 (+),score=137.76 TRINITY_DN8610_c0_g4_i5:59-1792(+)
METLTNEFKKNPNAEYLNLEFCQITNLSNLLPSIERFRRLKELSLYGNRLTSLPNDLSGLETLESLDISNNIFSNIGDIIQPLKTLPNLRSLTVNLRNKEEEKLIISELPFLETLNAINLTTTTKRNNPTNNRPKPQQQAPTKEYKDGSIFKQEDLESVAVLYDVIRELFKKRNPDLDAKLAEEFDEHVRNIMIDLGEKLKVHRDDIDETTNHLLKAKFALYEICFAKIIEYTSLDDTRVSTILEGIHDCYALLFKEYPMLVNRLVSKTSNTSVKNAPTRGQESDELEKLRKAHEDAKKTWEEEKKELMEQISYLTEENQRCLNVLLRHSKDGQQRLEMANEGTVPDKENESPKGHRRGITQTKTIRTQHITNQNINTPIGTTNLRTLTLGQLHDVVEEIYSSKTKFDEKYFEGKLPRETMEQHMYTFLNQKYGLKNLIVEWATAIINGLRKYAAEDNDVAVFGKILKNECDEEFRFVQAQVKNTITELLKMHLKGKYPLKHATEIKDMLNSKISSSILEEEAIDIVRYMYNKDDAAYIIERLQPNLGYAKGPADTLYILFFNLLHFTQKTWCQRRS